MQLYDAGMVKYWRRQHYPENKCSSVDDDSDLTGKKASLADTQGAFIILFTGVLLAAVLLSGEWLWTSIKKDNFSPQESDTISRL